MRTSKMKYCILLVLVAGLNACSNALYFYETEKVSLTVEARPDSSQPVQGSLGVKQRVVLLAPKKQENDDAVAAISSFSFKVKEVDWAFNPVLIQTAFITGDAAKLLTPAQAQNAAAAIALNGIKTSSSDITAIETAKSIIRDLTNDADRNLLKIITEKDFDSLSAQDYVNILHLTGIDQKNYPIELHQTLQKELSH